MPPASPRPEVSKVRSFSEGAKVNKARLEDIGSRRRMKRAVAGPAETLVGGDALQRAIFRNIEAKPRSKKMDKDRNINVENARVTEIRQPRPTVRRLPQKSTKHLTTHDTEGIFDEPPTPTMTLQPSKTTSVHRGSQEPIGLTIDETLTVTKVIASSPAEAAGLKAGAKLTSVNGQQVRSQDDAVMALLRAGDTVEIGTSVPMAAQLRGMTAGLSTERRAPLRRKGSVATEYRRESTSLFQPEPEPVVQRPPGLGPPGLGPMPTPWSEKGGPGVSPDPSHSQPRENILVGHGHEAQPIENDAFKPNTYIPRLSAEERGSRFHTQRGRNMTSYEVAASKGEVDDNGMWGEERKKKGGKQHFTLKEFSEYQNGNIIRYGPPVGEAETKLFMREVSPRAGKDRHASPANTRGGLIGPLGVGHDTPTATGRRIANLERYHTFNDNLLSFDPTHHKGSERRSLTPGRLRSSHHDHGDIIGHRWEGDAPRAQTPRSGRRSAVTEIKIPRPVPRSFTPTPRHQKPSPYYSDIFNQGRYQQRSCADMADMTFKGSKGALSPRNNSSNFEISYRPEPQEVEAAQTPRRGRGLGTAAPSERRDVHGLSTPWSERE